jgi:predicted outer membrane repeat protein
MTHAQTTGGSCSFAGNAGGIGGALFVGDGASMEITDSVSFSKNKATVNGGALVSAPNSSVSISGSNVSFAGNKARRGGQGAFYGKVEIQVCARACACVRRCHVDV